MILDELTQRKIEEKKFYMKISDLLALKKSKLALIGDQFYDRNTVIKRLNDFVTDDRPITSDVKLDLKKQYDYLLDNTITVLLPIQKNFLRELMVRADNGEFTIYTGNLKRILADGYYNREDKKMLNAVRNKYGDKLKL